ncbi:MAG: alpha/beta fold hydrolase [Bacteroidia bacterium]
MIFYNKTGTGNVIVLLHGFCENSTCFSEQVFFLRQYFTVITPDLPGSGNSAPLEDTTMEKMADEVYKILQHENISSCLMLGHSMGGYVTLAFAKKYSTLLKGIGLMHSTAYADSEERKLKRDQAIRVIEEKGAELYVNNFIPPLFSPNFSDKNKIAKMLTEGNRTSVKGLTEVLRAMRSRHDSSLFLQETDLPVLFIAGKNDLIIPENDIFKQTSFCKQSEIIYLENSAHMGMIEEPEKFSQAIKNFASGI